MICRKATFTVSVSAVTLSNAIPRLPEHKNAIFVLKRPENEGSRPQMRTKMPILCLGMVAASSAALPRALRGASGSSAPGNRLPQPTTQPAAVHAAGNCPRATYRRGTTAKSYRRVLPPGILPCIPPGNLPAGHTTARWVLPRDGSRAQRAGDSDVGANDKGACDDPGDGVDAH